MEFVIWNKAENRQLTPDEVSTLIEDQVIFIDIYYLGDKKGAIFINVGFNFEQDYELRAVKEKDG